MYTLFLDTHDKDVIVIIYKDGKIVGKKDIVSNNKHSQVTLPAIVEVLEDVKLDINDMENVIVVNGPGSFTGERIAVTIAKTVAYCLHTPIRTINSLLVMALSLDKEDKYVALEDRNGAFVGHFDINNKLVDKMVYLNKSSYLEYKNKNDVITEVNIDYEKVYDYVMNNIDSLNPHEVKPLYIKGISALNDK
ncbi:MAG TPA: tRNA (adenosine(37)-N6)-threonylcarbamoyltransferase complex dimerization subunit type 1 TsaB [Firmicutes bacterium]|nr:tRNA (adenosine(37)-N6)-threonylcarbamoyltransferase complex dimerization subunit type 1 TsaB [Bacillota bacterium]